MFSSLYLLLLSLLLVESLKSKNAPKTEHKKKYKLIIIFFSYDIDHIIYYYTYVYHTVYVKHMYLFIITLFYYDHYINIL